MADVRAALCATAKNEGPFLLEWVAYHLEAGFTDIIIFQNDSDDLTLETLTCLQDIGAVQFFDNPAAAGRHQVRAYKRAAALPAFSQADVAMALDLDEFLAVKIGDGRVQDLIAAVPQMDRMCINWRLFGSAGQLLLSDDLSIERFTMCDTVPDNRSRLEPFKTLFRPSVFQRPGVHNPFGLKPGVTEVRTVNGSGLVEGEFAIQAFQCTDPRGYALAQINHYMTRDAMSFVLKSARGSAHQANRKIKLPYWINSNRNATTDPLMLRRVPRVRHRMQALDDQSRGRLEVLRDASHRLHRQRFAEMIKDPDIAEFYEALQSSVLIGEENTRRARKAILARTENAA